MNFASDNIVGASAPVLQAIVQANAGAMAAYGNDEISKRVFIEDAQCYDDRQASKSFGDLPHELGTRKLGILCQNSEMFLRKRPGDSGVTTQ